MKAGCGLPFVVTYEWMIDMKKAASLYKGWRMKRDFLHLVHTTDPRLLLDVGISPDVVEQRRKTPFWKF